MITSDEQRLAELRAEWQRHPDRRAEIEAEAQEIQALHLLRTHLGAEVLETTEHTPREGAPVTYLGRVVPRTR